MTAWLLVLGMSVTRQWLAQDFRTRKEILELRPSLSHHWICITHSWKPCTFDDEVSTLSTAVLQAHWSVISRPSCYSCKRSRCLWLLATILDACLCASLPFAWRSTRDSDLVATQITFFSPWTPDLATTTRPCSSSYSTQLYSRWINNSSYSIISATRTTLLFNSLQS